MRRIAGHAIVSLPIALGLLFLSGCGNPHEARATEAIAILESMADELSKVTDAASAEAAKPRLAELGDRWRENERKQRKQKPPTTREMAALLKKYGAQFDSANSRYDSERNRVKKIEGGAEAIAALGDLTGQPVLPRK
jgi:hypothetical protein